MTINVHAILCFQFEDKRIRWVEEPDLSGDFKFTENKWVEKKENRRMVNNTSQ